MDRAAIEDFFAPFAPVTVKRMFSGHGVYVDDACFALVLRGDIWLKADAATKTRFAEAGCRPFSYETKMRAMTVESFWTLPDEALDNEDALKDWCALALEAARRTATVKAAATARKADRGRLSEARKATAQRLSKPRA